MPPHCDSIDGAVVTPRSVPLTKGASSWCCPSWVDGLPHRWIAAMPASRRPGTRTFSGRSCLKAVRRFYVDERDRPVSSLSSGSPRGHWGEIVESTGSRPGLHDLSFLPTLPIAALLAVVFEVMLNRTGVT